MTAAGGVGLAPRGSPWGATEQASVCVPEMPDHSHQGQWPLPALRASTVPFPPHGATDRPQGTVWGRRRGGKPDGCTEEHWAAVLQHVVAVDGAVRLHAPLQ